MRIFGFEIVKRRTIDELRIRSQELVRRNDELLNENARLAIQVEPRTAENKRLREMLRRRANGETKVR